MQHVVCFALKLIHVRTTSLAGKHCVQELYKADANLLNDGEFIGQTLREAAVAASATILDVSVHAFPKQGVTAFILLAESHISFHSWPEHGYAAIDVFTCGDTTEPEKACELLASKFRARSQHIITLDRYIPEYISKPKDLFLL